MINQLKIGFLGILAIGIFYTYTLFTFSYDLVPSQCHIIKKNDYCYLELVNGMKCLSDYIRYWECEKYENMGIIDCYARVQNFMSFCKLYDNVEKLHRESFLDDSHFRL
jgi:hypothetical protein